MMIIMLNRRLINFSFILKEIIAVAVCILLGNSLIPYQE